MAHSFRDRRRKTRAYQPIASPTQSMDLGVYEATLPVQVAVEPVFEILTDIGCCRSDHQVDVSCIGIYPAHVYRIGCRAGSADLPPENGFVTIDPYAPTSGPFEGRITTRWEVQRMVYHREHRANSPLTRRSAPI